MVHEGNRTGVSEVQPSSSMSDSQFYIISSSIGFTLYFTHVSTFQCLLTLINEPRASLRHSKVLALDAAENGGYRKTEEFGHEFMCSSGEFKPNYSSLRYSCYPIIAKNNG